VIVKADDQATTLNADQLENVSGGFAVDAAADSAPGIDLNEDHRSVFGDGDWYIINRSVERLFE